MIRISLIMSIYAKENPIFLSQCLNSIVTQTVLPDEWIIIKDGPLTGELDAILDTIDFPNELKFIALPENVTQGPARAEGVKAAKYEWIAVMDSDDICEPDRFEKQQKMIDDRPELGLIGGQIAEFISTPDDIVTTRIVPTEHADIKNYAKKRNPFNQMTVMFKRDLVLGVGNYDYFPWFEDYDLWARMIAAGAICANHPDVLVKARVGSGMYGRRRGGSYIRSELRMQRQLKNLGLINLLGYFRNIIVRVPARLLPEKVLASMYKRFARSSG